MASYRLPIASILLLLITSPAWGANILGLFSSHSQSHLILHMSMINTLAEEGHNVTVVSMMKPTVMHKNIHHIMVPVTEEQERTLDNQLTTMAGQKNSIFSSFTRLMTGLSVIVQAQADLLSDERFQRIYETKFDLMILGYFLNDFQLGVAAKLKVPVIVAWVQAPVSIINTFVGNPTEISYVPSMGTQMGRGERMGFTKRLENLFKDVFIRTLTYILDHRMENFHQQLFGKESNFPTRSKLMRNVSMVFTNSHSISEGPIRPLVPASVEIGGIQIKDKPNPLPKDLAKFMDTAEHGVIFLSMGSNIKSTSIKPELVKSMFNVLAGLKQRVLWKWENLDNTPGEASNILFKKWLPQDDILAHPKTKLFITHAGKGGVTEAQYHGVPMVALPIFGDQPTNAATIEKSGYGLALELLQLTEEGFKASIEEVLNNDQYTLAIQKFSKLYRDRPMTPKQTVSYWTNYVLRHKGAPHIQNPAVHMDTVAYFNLDLYAFLIVILIVMLLLTGLTIRCVSRKLLGRRNNKGQKKVKTN